MSLSKLLKKFSCVACFCVISTSSGSLGAPLRYGDLLVANLGLPAAIYQYRDSNLLHAYTGSQRELRGASYTPSGRIVTTWDEYLRGPSGLFVFNASTGGVQSITTNEVVLPGDVSVTAAGNYVVNDQWGQDIDVYSPNGAHLRTIELPPLSGEMTPMGNTIAPDGSIWVTLARNQDVLHFGANGGFLGSFRPGFNPGDIVVDPVDGTLWFPSANSNTVHNFSPQGQQLSSFVTALPPISQAFLGIAITPNRELYISSTEWDVIYRYDHHGSLLGSLHLPNESTVTFMNVVVPEPTATAVLANGFFVLSLVRPSARRRVPLAKPGQASALHVEALRTLTSVRRSSILSSSAS